MRGFRESPVLVVARHVAWADLLPLLDAGDPHEVVLVFVGDHDALAAAKLLLRLSLFLATISRILFRS